MLFTGPPTGESDERPSEGERDRERERESERRGIYLDVLMPRLRLIHRRSDECQVCSIPKGTVKKINDVFKCQKHRYESMKGRVGH